MAVLNPVVGVPTNLLFVGVAKFGHRCTVGAQAVRRTEHTSLKSVEAPLNCDPAELAKSSAWRWAMIALTGTVKLTRFWFVRDASLETHCKNLVHWRNKRGYSAEHKKNYFGKDISLTRSGKSLPIALTVPAKVVTALKQKILDVPQRQWKPDIQHHDLADQLG